MIESPPRAWAEINLSALKNNLRIARERSGKNVMAVIKGGAYGHGLEEVARALDPENLPYLGVANAGEARRLDRAGIKTRPYILGATLPAEREEIAAREWTPCLCSFEEIDHFNSLGQTNPVQKQDQRACCLHGRWYGFEAKQDRIEQDDAQDRVAEAIAVQKGLQFFAGHEFWLSSFVSGDMGLCELCCKLHMGGPAKLIDRLNPIERIAAGD